MLEAAFSTMRDLPRLHEITTVLIRHGLGDIVLRLGVSGILERAGQMLQWGASIESAQREPAERLRLAFEELGPTFVKLGQVLATRVDLLPPDWITEFERLHRGVSPVPFEKLLPERNRLTGTLAFRGVRRSRHACARVGIDRPGPLREAQGRHAGRAEDSKAGNPSQGRGRPPAARPSRVADRPRNAGGAALPAGRDRRAIHALARARARLHDRGEQHRPICEAFRRRSVHRHPARLRRVDQRDAARAGAHHRHPGNRSRMRSRPHRSTSGSSPRVGPRRSCA